MITKRDGTQEPFESEKIYKALFKAFIACGYPSNKITKKAITKILKHIDEESMETVEDIQDEVENLLMDKHYYDVAKAYIIYREKHSQLRNFTDHKIQFIQKYRKSDNTANSTVDDNSNVNGKNIGILNAEIHKEDNIQISRRMVIAKLKEIFPDFDASQYQKDLNHHIIYKHDESSFAGAIAPYTYSPKETVEVKYGNNHWLVALDTLYNLINDTEEVLLDEDKEVYAKFPEELYIKDKNDFTLVTRLIKKRRHRPLVRVKTSFGEDLIVTDNHPLIVSDNIEETIEANKAQGYKQLRLPSDIHFDGTTEIDISKHLVCSAVYKNYILQQQESFCTYSACKRYIQLDEYFGYIVGFFIGDGHYDNGKSVLSFTQKEKETLEILAEYIYQSTGVMSTIEYKKDKINCWRMQVHSKALFILFKDYFQIKDYAQNKNLPINILETNEIFAKGIIEGLIDSDGTIQNNGAGILLRLASREAINQMTTLLRYFNFGVANTIQNLPFPNNTQYNTNYTIWGVSFNNTVGATKLTLSYKWKNKINREITKYVKYVTGWVNIDSISELETSSFIQQCDYIYDITTESHTFNSSNLLVHNCTSITMYPFLLEGLKKIGGLSAAPKNLDSFCGMYINLIFAIAAMYAGAIATSEFLLYFTYFCKKEWGEDFYQHPDKEITVNSARSKTVRSQIHQYWQQVIYSINQPAAARGLQSAFVNFSYFDHPFFEGMFGDFYFPDGTKPDWESLCWIQKEFMQWFNQERLKCILTFPVESFALVYKDGEFLDKDSANFVVEEYARGHSFFTYISDTVDSLSSCCFSKDTKVLWKNSFDGVKCTTLEELHNLKWEPYKKNLRIFHNGSWVKGKSVKLSNRPMYKVTTYNNKEFIMSDNHINVTYTGEKTTEQLTTEDYLMFNTVSTQAITENNEYFTYEQGLLVGLFLGDGTFGNCVCLDGSVHSFQLSLNKDKWEQVKDSLATLGEFKLGAIYNNVYPIHCYDKDLTTFIAKWTGNEPNNTWAHNKSLNLNCLLQSVEFRQGILDGWYITDGGNSNRCYTISKKLVENMEMLCTSLGLQTVINVSDRTDEAVVIRGQEYSRNYPLYCLRWYTEANHRCNKTKDKSWKKKNNSVYWKIKSIESIDYKDDIYCIECENQDEPYFTLPSGLITHNCRLKNMITTKEFNFTNGNMGVQTGSKSVITLNLNRIIQDWYRGWHTEEDSKVAGSLGIDWSEDREDLQHYLKHILERVYKYHTAYNELLWDMYDAGLLPVYKAGFINLNKQYLTIGLNGLNQAAEFLGISCTDNADYSKFCQLIFGTIKEANAEAKGTFNKHKLTFNTECVPAESLAVKNYNWDKEEGYKVPTDTNLYASYIFKPNDANITVLNRLKLHGNNYIGEYLDGGSACHVCLDHHLSIEQYRKLLKYAAEEGCQYFTFNIPNCECDECGYITKHPITECPKCGSKQISYYDRVIGYLTKIKNWSEGRQIEQKTRIYSKEVEC